MHIDSDHLTKNAEISKMRKPIVQTNSLWI